MRGVLVAVFVLSGVLSWPGFESALGADPLDYTPEEQAWLDDHKVVRVMVGTWPPFHSMKDGKPVGLAFDYVSFILNDLGLEVEPVPILWHDALTGISRFERIDLLPTIARSAEREKLVAITADYLSFPMVIFTQMHSDFVGSLDDLNGKTVAVENNFIMHSRLARDHPDITLMLTETSEEALKAISSGTADAYVGNLAVGSNLIDRLGLVNVKVAAHTSYEHDIQAMGVRKDWPELVSLLNKRLLAITDEEHQRLRQSALTVRFEHGIDVVLLGWIGGSIAVVIAGFVYWNRRLGREVRERKQAQSELNQQKEILERLSDQLSKYLSPQIYESIFSGAQEAEITTKRKKLTIFFSDIKDFTETTEALQPEDLTFLLNEYFSMMTEIALNYGGTIDKFVGDAILIFFGDPETKGVKEDAQNCVQMAIAMQHQMEVFHGVCQDKGVEKPFQIRIGINTGYCNVGNFGSQSRMDYTVIGGEVNLAARLEAVAEPGGIALSQETYALAKDFVNAEQLPAIRVKGIARDITPFKVTGIHDDLESDRRFIRRERQGLKVLVDLAHLPKGEREQAAADLRAAADEIQAG